MEREYSTKCLEGLYGRETSAATVDDWKRLDRFLAHGSEGSRYVAGGETPTAEKAEAAQRLIAADGLRVVRRAVVAVDAGRVARTDGALFVLALASALGDERTRRAAFRALPVVARTGEELFRFAEYVGGMRGWGRGLRSAVGGWYCARSIEEVAREVARETLHVGGEQAWSHRDLVRKAHPSGAGDRDALFAWITRGRRPPRTARALDVLQGFLGIRRARSATAASRVVDELGLTPEMLPAELRDSREIWEAMLERMPYRSLLEELPTLTRVGVLRPGSEAMEYALGRIESERELRDSGMHSTAVLAAMTTYQAGRDGAGVRVWRPSARVGAALERTLERSFGLAARTGKFLYVALDVSGSMNWGEVAGTPGISPRQAAAALTLCVLRSEPYSYVAAFQNEMREVDVTAGDPFEAVCEKTRALPFGGTDCAAPILDALGRKMPVECFVVLTDSETWFGEMHPREALAAYREAMGIEAKLVTVSLSGADFHVADSEDAGMLDVVGFDEAAPRVIADFIGG